MYYDINKPFGNAVRILSTVVFKKGMVIAWITLIVMLFATMVTWFYTQNNIEKDARIKFNNITNDIRLAITERMLTYEQVLRGTSGLFYASGNVTRKDWENYVKNLKINEKYPGIFGIGFSKIVNKEEKDELIKQFRAEGFPNFRIWPENEREIYTAIIYFEPLDKKNQRILGYDMFSEPTRRRAMELARDYGEATLSGKVIHIQETVNNIQAGCLMYLPLYSMERDTSTLEGRRKSIIGYVYSPFRMTDLITRILGKKSENIKLEIYDDQVVTIDKLMFSSMTTKVSEFGDRHYYDEIQSITISGRVWTLRFASLPEFEATIDKEKPLLILITGILISSLFFIITRNLSNIFIMSGKLEQLLESTIEGIYGIDPNGRCTFINNSAARMLGYQVEECIKKDMHKLIHYKKENGDTYPVSECPNIISMRKQKGCFIDTDVFWRRDGTSFPIEYSSYPIIDDKQTTGAIIAFTDISERKKYLAQIESSLKEKEVLLREIHHRVKNNLQIISSMLNIQSSYIIDKKSQIIFEESRNRVRSMALIHEKLYQNESLSKLNLKEYVKELVDNLMKSYKDINQIDVEIKINEIFLNADTAIPLGLIINELVSNSFKYAFPGERKGKIMLSIFPISSNRFRMTVKDDGIGLPGNFDFNNTDTLGLQLVNSLVSQLDGEIVLQNESGTQFDIDFRAISQHNGK